jgi:hypothetical protein
MATNLQTFSGEVEIPEGNLQLKRILELSGNNASTSNTGILFSRNLGSTSNSNVIVYFDEATESLRFGHTLNASSDSEIIMDSANVLNVNVFGEVEASYFKGDGGLLSNLVTDLQSVTENGAETDQTLVLTNAVTGIDVQTGNVNVAGNVTASIFFGDGGLLSNITQTLQGITEIGNTTSIALEFNNVTTGFVTTSNVGIVNTSPQHNFSVGSNLYVHDTDSNVLTVEGNVSAHKLTLGTIEITPAYGLENVTNISNLAHATLLFQNTTTAFVTTAMAGIGLEPDSSDVGASGLHVDGHLRLGGPAGTDENSDIYLRTAGQLNIESNDTDTDNQYTALALRAGNANESNIVVEGALSDTSKQYISFGVRNQERMKIDREGNVTVGYASTSHKLDVAGSANVTTLNASNLVINTVSISVQYDLDQTLENGNVSTNVITVGKVSVTDPTLAQTASNLVTWNATTKEFEDSGGLISNKLAIVSEQPPVALTGDSTVVDGHGRYKVTSSSEGSEPDFGDWNCFNKATGGNNAWSSDQTYDTVTFLHDGTQSIGGIDGEWVKLELPYKTRLRHISLQPRADGDTTELGPGTFSIIGSNDDSSWTLLKQITGVAASDYSSVTQKQFVIDASASYKYYALVVEKIAGGSYASTNPRTIIGEWRLFTETFTVDAGVVSTTAASGLDVGYTEHPVEAMANPIHYAEGHGTYEADASSKSIWFHSSFGSPFDYVIENNMWESDANWSSSNVYNNANWTTDVGGTRHYGEWLQLKNPYAITLAYTDVYPRALSTNGTSRGPGAGVILGSNDGENWYKLTEFSGKTYTNGVATKIDVNATTPYTWYRIVTSKLANATAIDTRVDIGEWRLFAEKPVTRMENVHISGELSSETLHTGYIKWPRVPLKANDSEGYVASASTEYPSGTSYYAWHAFEDKGEYSNDVGSFPAWLSHGGFVDGQATISRTTGTDTFNHEWLQIQMPSAICLSHFTFSRRNVAAEMPKSGRMYGSNDGISWTKLISFSNNTETNVRRIEVKSRTLYSYFRFAITEIQSGTNHACVDELQLFEAATGVGAAPTSAKLQVAGSLGMAKGAEFFAGDDVVMELPKHDRPLTKYPEVNMTAATTAGYTVTHSGTPYPGGYEGWRAFDGVSTTEWISDSTARYNTTTPFDANSPSTDGLSGISGVQGTRAGSWVKLELPKKIRLQKTEIFRRDVSDQRFDQAYVYGSNDDTTWYELSSITNPIYGQPANASGDMGPSIISHSTDSTTFYKYFVIQITSLVDNVGTANIGQAYFYGTEEGDTSVDVVHRSIPNKPGQQHLEVYWDANDSNSYSFADSSNVFDLSGSGVTGTIGGSGNTFDTTYSAWKFTTSSSLKSPALSISGDYVHSMSVWFRLTSEPSTWSSRRAIMALHADTGISVNSEVSTIVVQTDGTLRDNFWGNDIDYTSPFKMNTWHHVVFTYSGTSGTTDTRKIYVDTKLLTDAVTSGGDYGDPLNLPNNSKFAVGEMPGVGLQGAGDFSNARLFSKALNAEQVRELYEYDAERFGHRQNLVALHKGNLGVGVAHPTSRFEVAGADGLQEFPPKAMTGYETYIEGHGVFRASESNTYTSISAPPWQVFDNSTTTFWHSNTVYNEDTGLYEGEQSLGGYAGEWISLTMPYKTKINTMLLRPRVAWPERTLYNGVLLGANSDEDWELVKQFSSVTFTDGEYKYLNIDSIKYYTKYALVVTRTNPSNARSDSVQFSIFRLFGTPTPSALEDGHLTLGKALTLPRVSGHAAGAETPRAESLVVHYDTTVDSVVSGSTVVDISGYGRNGTLSLVGLRTPRRTGPSRLMGWMMPYLLLFRRLPVTIRLV